MMLWSSLSMAAAAMKSTTMESSGMESAKGMATAEMSSAETMAKEVVSPIVGPVVPQKTAAGIPTIKSTHNPVPSASAKQKDGGSSY
jgi:hypothetical protein